MEGIAFPPPAAFCYDAARITHRRHLPHMEQVGCVYFITFRLADSLPQERLDELQTQRNRWLARHPEPHSPEEEAEFRRIWRVPVELDLDAGWGKCVLRRRACRNRLEKVLRHSDGTRYRLGDFVIMPNHVHALVQLGEGMHLPGLMKAWKSTSSRRIGEAMGTTGQLWQEEYFDHIVRGEDGLAKCATYILRNPERLRAGDYRLARGTLKCGG